MKPRLFRRLISVLKAMDDMHSKRYPGLEADCRKGAVLLCFFDIIDFVTVSRKKSRKYKFFIRRSEVLVVFHCLF